MTLDDLAVKLAAQSEDPFEVTSLVRVTEADVDAYEERAGAMVPETRGYWKLSHSGGLSEEFSQIA